MPSRPPTASPEGEATTPVISHPWRASRAAAAIAGAGYWGQQRMNHAMSDVMASSTAQKNLLQADMMHDALRADVLTAMLAGQKPEKQRAAEGKQIVESLREHAGVFRESIDENKSLPLDAGIKERIAESESVLNAYIGAAESAVALALRDQASLAALTEDVVKTSEIEGEVLNVESVRSSIARRLGVDIGSVSVCLALLRGGQDGPGRPDRLFRFPLPRHGPDTGRGHGDRSREIHVVDHRLPENGGVPSREQVLGGGRFRGERGRCPGQRGDR